LECPKTDSYGRSVCNVWVAPASAADGPLTLDAGLAMVAQGMAKWYRAYAREQTPEARGQHEFAESEARAKRAGLWSDLDLVPPWEWRGARANARELGLRPSDCGALVPRLRQR
jgi:endonuclease YncB( thermonuclease family)